MYVTIKRIILLIYLTFNFMFLTVSQAQVPGEAKTVTVTVLNETTGAPIPGASVSVQNFSSALTDDNGSAAIKIPDAKAVVTISAPGRKTKEVALKGRESITIKLFSEREFSYYDKVNLPSVSTTADKNPGAATSLNVREPWMNPSEASPENYLSGKIAGLDIKKRSGMPGAGSNFYLRGINFMNSSNQPLFVVDGMPYDIRNFSDNVINGYITNPLMYINANDIENITVIKDASASVYGSKAANGVIVITTKHPENEASSIDFIASAGRNLAQNEFPLMNAFDYRTFMTEMWNQYYNQYRTNLQDPNFNPYNYNTDPISQPNNYLYVTRNNTDYFALNNNTDWQKQIFSESYNQNYYLRVSGGDNVGKYSLSAGYSRNSGMLSNSQSSTYGMRFNADFNMSKKFLLNANFSLYYNNSDLFDDGIETRTNPIFLGLVKAPFLSPYEMSQDGTVSPNLMSADDLGIGNPQAIINNMSAQTKNYRFLGNVKGTYKINDHLAVSSTLGLPFDKVRQAVYVPIIGTLPDTASTGLTENNRMQHAVNRMFSLFNDSRIEFKNGTEKGSGLYAVMGVRYTFTETQGLAGTQYNSPNDRYHNLGTGSTAAKMRQIGGYLGDSKEMSFYTSVNYLFRNKYSLAVNAAMDGSSRFGDNANGISLFSKKFGFFPSVAAGWLVSSEKFMAGANYVDLLKIRASYGLTGNDDINNKSAMQYYSSQPYLGSFALQISDLPNDKLQWEENLKADLGLDLALFNERVNMTFDVYQNNVKNMLVLAPVNSVAGTTFTLQNAGELENKGFEVSVNTRILAKKLKWDLGFSVAHYENKITKLPAGNTTLDVYGANVVSREGHPINVFYGYKTNGVYSSDKEASEANLKLALPNNVLLPVQAGDIKFVDETADGVIDENDMVEIGNPNPDLTGSISSRLSWKRLTLEGLFTFSYGNEIYNYQRRMLESMNNYYNQTTVVLNRWKYQGQVTDIPRAIYGDPTQNARFSDRWIEDGSFLRLKTVTLSYNLPIKSNLFKYVTISASGYNLFTLTKYLGYNPDLSIGESYMYQGIDLGLAPEPRAVYFGIKLGL